MSLSEVDSWAFWAQNIVVDEVASSPFDMVVIDYSPDGTEQRAFKPGALDRMKNKPDGSPRIILAYLSIGEAENYRYYWRDGWFKGNPSWLSRENPDWPGNFLVSFWDPEWQALIFGSPGAYLDKILAVGFDGVYLDLVDAFENWEDLRPSAAEDMVDFVRRLSLYAKSNNGGKRFFIVPQNGEELLRRPDYVRAIDGIAREDLYYGYTEDGVPTPAKAAGKMDKCLKIALKAGKSVFTIDYVAGGKAIEAYKRSRREGFKPYATVRELDRLTINKGLDVGYSNR